MRILLDECLDWRLTRGLIGHDVRTVQDMGWCGVKNGALLQLAQGQFELFITSDRNLSFQQNVSNLPFAVVVLQTVSLRLTDTAPLMAKVLALIPIITPGSVFRIVS